MKRRKKKQDEYCENCPLIGGEEQQPASGENAEECRYLDPATGHCSKRSQLRRPRGLGSVASPRDGRNTAKRARRGRRKRGGSGGGGPAPFRHQDTSSRLHLKDPTPKSVRHETPLNWPNIDPLNLEVKLPPERKGEDGSSPGRDSRAGPGPTAGEVVPGLDVSLSDLRANETDVTFTLTGQFAAMRIDPESIADPTIEPPSGAEPAYEIRVPAPEDPGVDLAADPTAQDAAAGFTDRASPQIVDGISAPLVPFDGTLAYPGITTSLPDSGLIGPDPFNDPLGPADGPPGPPTGLEVT